jgi:uncharacterized protein (TIGR03083 family)
MEATTFFEALDVAIGVVADPAVAEAWAAPSALAGYTVGGLCAHLQVATARTASVLEDEAPAGDGVRLVSIPEYYGPARIDDPGAAREGLAAFLVDDGNERAAAGPASVAASFAALPARLRPLLAAAAPDRLVPVVQVPGGATPLDGYLTTRLLELVVHTDDLAASVGMAPPEPSPAAVGELAALLTSMAVARVGGLGVIRAFTRAERAAPDALRVL